MNFHSEATSKAAPLYRRLVDDTLDVEAGCMTEHPIVRHWTDARAEDL